jgi:hypothetical protein
MKEQPVSLGGSFSLKQLPHHKIKFLSPSYFFCKVKSLEWLVFLNGFSSLSLQSLGSPELAPMWMAASIFGSCPSLLQKVTLLRGVPVDLIRVGKRKVIQAREGSNMRLTDPSGTDANVAKAGR